MIKKAAAWRLLKYPQGRGAHHKAVATSGGIIIIFPIVLLAWWVHVAWWLPMGMVLLAALGFADDHHDISFLKKLLCQLLLVLLVVVFLLPLPLPRGVFSFLQYVLPDEQWPLTNLALWVIFSVGWINFFNFMDGSDGHAGVQAILMLIGFFVFSDGSGFVSDTAMTVINHAVYKHEQVVIGAIGALLGFLYWNRPRAKIFMGDAGSLSLGFFLLGLMWLSSAHDARQLGLWLILGAVFFTDCIVTIISLALQRKKFWLPHNLFAFQKILRFFPGSRGHAIVVILNLTYGLLWLYPLAYGWGRYPELSYVWFLLAYTPIFLTVIFLRAGVVDRPMKYKIGDKKT